MYNIHYMYYWTSFTSQLEMLFPASVSCFVPTYTLFVAPSVCEPNPCANNGICTETDDSFSCRCHDGFSGNLCELTSDGELDHSYFYYSVI